MATVAQVAADEPDTEPKMPQASTLTCIRRPGSQLSQGARPRNISSDRRVRNRISPIQMNSGSAASVHDALLPQIVVASTWPAGNVAADILHADPAAGHQRDRDPDAAREQDGEQDQQHRGDLEKIHHRAAPTNEPAASSAKIQRGAWLYTPLWIACSTTSSAVCGFGFS